MQEYQPPKATGSLTTGPLPQDESSPITAAPPSAPKEEAVNIPVRDVEFAQYSDDVRAAILERARLAAEASAAQEVWSRSSEKQRNESDQDHQDRIKREFEAAVLAVRKQETAPPLPPMPVPSAIAEQTRKEMEAGRKQSEYWKSQQVHRPLPTVKEIREAGSNTPVFRPGEYMHEKGGLDKNLVTQNQPVRG